MNRVPKILVPIDFSEESANGLKYALSLAQETSAEIIALHVTQKKHSDSLLHLLAVMEGWPMLNPPATIPVDRLVREKTLDLYYFIEKVIKNSGPVKIRRKVAIGTKAEKILAVANEEGVGLVVLAMHKKSLFPYLLALGKLLRVIPRFRCAVLLKPPLFESRPRPMGPLFLAGMKR